MGFQTKEFLKALKMLTWIVIICERGLCFPNLFAPKTLFMDCFTGTHIAKHWCKVMTKFKMAIYQLFLKWENAIFPMSPFSSFPWSFVKKESTFRWPDYTKKPTAPMFLIKHHGQPSTLPFNQQCGC